MSEPRDAEFAPRLSEPATREATLAELLVELDGRAIGLWRVEGDHLVQLGFGAVPDMPAETRERFRELTRSVPLSEVGYGIVSAVVRDRVTPARREAEDLANSASWLVRFDSESSLSVPIRSGEVVTGVMAMSSANVLDAERGTGQRLVRIASDVQLR